MNIEDEARAGAWDDSERPTIGLAREIAGWDQGNPATSAIPHWAVNLAAHLLDKGWHQSKPSDTPIEKLDDAVREFFRACGMPENVHITGWALGASTSRLQLEDPDSMPMVDGERYALGPGTTVANMAGLAQYLRVVTERAMWRGLDIATGEGIDS